MSLPGKGTPVALHRAIANLLRLADTELRDARVLIRNDSLRNAAMLECFAVSCLTAATIVPEQGWPADVTTITSAELDENNPVKARLQALETGSYRNHELLPDGHLPKVPDKEALRDRIERATALLGCLSEHFKVDLGSEAPAGAASPVCPAPPPKRLQSPIAQKDVLPSTPVPRKPSRRRISDGAAQRPANRGAEPKRSGAAVAAVNPTPEPPPSAHPVSSTVFWSLMDRWGVPDLDALALLGHAGGLTQKGTRPRFKLTKAENEMMAQLQDIAGALDSLGLDPRRWLREPLPGAAFLGADPITVITRHRLPGARDLRHYILQQGLRLSLRQ